MLRTKLQEDRFQLKLSYPEKVLEGLLHCINDHAHISVSTAVVNRSREDSLKNALVIDGLQLIHDLLLKVDQYYIDTLASFFIPRLLTFLSQNNAGVSAFHSRDTLER